MNSDLDTDNWSKVEGLNPPFTNVYAEKDVEVPFDNKNVIRIDSYKDIFNRTHQDFDIQKRSPALILSRQRGQYIYEGARVCQSFGNEHFYYCSCMMNCMFDCDYCYLCGMYPTGNVVAFTSFEDILKEIDEILLKHPMYLCVSYDTDLLAAEHMFGFVGKFIEAVKTRKDLTIEIRTKSGNPRIFDRFEPSDRVIFAWTLSPETITKIERKTAPLDQRLAAMKSCSDKGFKIRVCLDPMIYYRNWEKDYLNLVDKVFSVIPSDSVYDVSIGVFRISTDYLKLMRKRRPLTPAVAFPFISENGVSHYGDISKKMIEIIRAKVSSYVPEDKIFIWEDQ
ncbi:MAG: radical SAM protein [Clostridiales bacterium]|nr:radical SAM protein [Clostridiales bacterium]